MFPWMLHTFLTLSSHCGTPETATQEEVLGGEKVWLNEKGKPFFFFFPPLLFI